MRKSLRLLAAAGACWLAPVAASAQYYTVPFINAGYNPGNFNADDEAQGVPGWATLLNGTPATRTAPVWSAMQSLPIPFSFDGQPVRRFRVSTSGVLTFDSLATVVPPTANTALPSADVPDRSVCVWGLTTGPNDNILTKTFGTAPNRQFWVQYNSVSQTGTSALQTYWSIVLQESSNTIFIVDQRTVGAPPGLTLTAGVQVSGTQALQVAGSPNLNTRNSQTGTTNNTASDNTFYMFEPGTQPAADMTIRSVSTPQMMGARAPLTLTGAVRNIGSQPVTSYQLGYSVNGGAPVIDNVTGVTIGPLGVNSFSHTVPFVPASAGTYTLKVWANQPNGQLDTKAFNDTTARVIVVADSSLQRTIIMESFTSSTCPPCRPGNVNIRAVQAANPGKAIKIAYQQNFPAPGNDPYYTLEGGARFNYYAGSYVPYMLLDGAWGDNSNSLTTAILNTFHAKPAFINVQPVISRAGTTVNATATITSYIEYPAGMVLQAVIVEKQTRNNARTNGETRFYDVMKKMMPDENGTVLPALRIRQPQTFSLSYTFPAGNNVESFDSLEVVMFVQDPVTKEIHNGSSAELARPSALADEVTFGALSVAPNPTVDDQSSVRLTLPTAQRVSADVLDALGRVVATVPAANLAAGPHELAVRLPATAHGIYVVRVKTGDTVRSRRLVVE